MAEVVLFIRDFQLGTRISDILTRQEKSVAFADSPLKWQAVLQPDSRLCLVDLDDEGYGNPLMVRQVRAARPDINIVGFLSHSMKDTVDKMKAAGCDLILTRSSLSRNIPSLIKNL